MKKINVATALLMGMMAASGNLPRFDSERSDGNESPPRNPEIDKQRLEAAQAKRDRKAAKRNPK